MEEELNKKGFSRRNFIKGTAGVAALGVLGACAPQTVQETPAATEAVAATGSASGWSWDTPPAAIADSDIVETIDTDVLVIGAGNSGVASACSASENGAKVIVLEKTTTINGRGGGVGACNSRLNKALGFEIEPVAAQYRWNRTCGNRNNEALVKLWFDHSGEAMNWLLDKADKRGAKYTLYAGYSHSEIAPEEPDFHTFQAGDFEMPDKTGYFVPTALVYADAVDQGVEFLFEHVAQYLIKEDGKVTGAVVSTPDGYKRFNASKAVILATGDIHGDKEMMQAYAERRMNDIIRSDYSPVGANTGDGHKMGMWAGAVMQEGPFPAALHPQACALFHGPFMFVNMEGHRYFNEANWVQAKSLQTMKQTDHIGFSIFDSNFGEDTKDSLNYGGGMFWDTMSRSVTQEFDPAEIEATVEGIVEEGKNGFKADTLEALADLIGVNKDNFLAEVAHYNECCKNGADDQYAKEAHFLYPIETGPFYAMKVGAAMLVMVGGLRINTDLQCIDADGNGIPGLYAVGNTSGDLYAVDYPINMPGNSNGRCLTWGYLVGKTVAAL
ncbi:MAG TPA: FAD-dependent oxidoreductase [Bellilinea sp.]|jgi:succinate dehydrogenase/fumarate reductase flavoprotein subunit|nr:FAD-dependent oxidoreductase [Bellilinea sp.]